MDNYKMKNEFVATNPCKPIDYSTLVTGGKDTFIKPQAPALISGADALRALADGKDIQARSKEAGEWHDLDTDNHNVPLTLLVSGRNRNGFEFEFRLKPQTIKLKLELPKPFEPEEGEKYWWINPNAKLGYEWDTNDLERTDFNRIAMSVWRTEDEIKQVVEQLRKIRCTNS